MWEKFVAFFMSIIAFFSSLFGFGAGSDNMMKNVKYGDHERQVMDLCLPEESDGEVGLMLMIHGGAWIEGSKDEYKSNIKDICKNYGYAAAAINYRYLSDEVDMYDILDDIGLALKVIKEKGAEKGISINKVILSGVSAGAHLSMLYAYARKDVSAIAPVAVVGYSGPTDLSDDNFYYNADLGGTLTSFGDVEYLANVFSKATGKDFTYENRHDYKEELLKVSPIYYVDENTVPTIINHGIKDTYVPYSNAVSLAEKFDEFGVTYKFNTYPNSNHDLGDDSDISDVANDLFHEFAVTYLGFEK